VDTPHGVSLAPAAVSVSRIRILTEPSAAVVGTTKLPLNGPTPSGEVYTVSPASVNDPLLFQSTQIITLSVLNALPKVTVKDLDAPRTTPVEVAVKLE